MAAQIFRWLISGALIGGMLHCPVFADTGMAENTVEKAEALREATSTPFGSAAVSSNMLDAYRGGAEVSVVNDNMLKGVVSENQAYNLNTGSNLVTDGSFAGASGLSTVIQNSGNNVLIQNSTIVNVQIK